MYQIIRVDSGNAEYSEPLGTKRKFWFIRDGKRFLFKADERGSGEDWAEKIACELCVLLGLPHVHYELAVESETETPGVVCENCAYPPITLALGNQLLLNQDPDYPAQPSRIYKVSKHSVAAVIRAVRELEPPANEWIRSGINGFGTALDFFVGYILLDAWIANQDRHHENWGALCDPSCSRLAPTFDHGASLARNISDRERKERLDTADSRRSVKHFVTRARSAFYASPENTRPMTTLDAFNEFANYASKAACAWKEQLESVTMNDMREVLNNVPIERMSKTARDFTLELLAENRRRILQC